MNRSEKVSALLPTVRDDQDGTYSCESLSLPGWRYTCRPKTETSPATCECEDYKHRAKSTAGYRCIHLLAVRAFVKAQREQAKPKPTQATPTQPKAPSLKKSLAKMGDTIKDAMARQAQALASIEPLDRYQSARERIESGEGDAFSEAEALDAWLEHVDRTLDEEPDGLAFVEAR